MPGCQLNSIEKIQVAKALEELGVDVIEAGFPVSSPGDFNSVVEISKAVTWPTICALTRAVEKDIDVAYELNEEEIASTIINTDSSVIGSTISTENI